MPRFSKRKRIKYQKRYKEWEIVKLDDDIVELRCPTQKCHTCNIESQNPEIQNQLADLTSALAMETMKVQKLTDKCSNFGVSAEEISDMLDEVEDEYFSEVCDEVSMVEVQAHKQLEDDVEQTLDDVAVEIMKSININHLDVFLTCDPDDEELLNCAILVVQNQLENCDNFCDIVNTTSKISTFMQLKFFLKLFVGVHEIVEKQNVRKNLLAQIVKLADRGQQLQMDQKEWIWLLHFVTNFYDFAQSNEVLQEINFLTYELGANQNLPLNETNFLQILVKLCTCQVLAMQHFWQQINAAWNSEQNYYFS
eukprot:TRINITY_DN1403_c0_g1_i13.p2 TRINITY_DN1403_c0_g1~~TRINITY_DN1403_c0_g1_i13.p2  ORF type:complete len:309 (-),score=41.33 TRINITY_DN1403_c0_g1_i13:1328-2254(-)